jgi:hypothetical protein
MGEECLVVDAIALSVPELFSACMGTATYLAGSRAASRKRERAVVPR